MRTLLFLLPAVLVAQGNVPPGQATRSKTTTGRSSAVRPGSAKPAAKLTPMTDDEKIIYALGLSIYQSLSQFDLSPSEVKLVQQAIGDAAAKKPAEDLSTWGPKIQGFAQARAGHLAEQERVASAAYLQKAAGEPGAVKTQSGLVYRELRAGTGASPKPTDTVKVNYRGTLVNGTEFDSSYSRNAPAEFPLNHVIPCWTEGLQMMKVGGKAMLACPASLAYGDQGRPSIPGGAALIFEIELLDIVQPPPGQLPQ